MTDTREKLEADVRSWWKDEFACDFYTDDDLLNITMGWLNRQAAITERECCERAEKVECDCCRWQDERDELQARLEKSCRDWLVDAGEYEQIADGMKKQIAELQSQLDRSMPLPLDADGVPIRVGDTVEYPDGYEMWTMRVGMIGRECVEECESGVIAKICRHVKPRTVGDVLLDVIEHAICPSNSWDEIIAKYAQELRMVGE